MKMKWMHIALYAAILAVVVKFGSWVVLEVLKSFEHMNVFQWFITFFIAGALMRYVKKSFD